MNILLNGKEYKYDNEINLIDLLEKEGINPESVVIELNGEIIKKETWKDILIKDQDKLEILRFVGGG